MQSVAVSRSYHTIFGLSNGDQGQDYTDIDYAIHLQGEAGWPGDLVIFEAGVQKANFGPTYIAGDVFRVAVEGGYVKYYKNGGWLYTSATRPTTALVLDGSVFHTGAKVKDAFLCKPRPQITPQRTLYIGGLYEEELTGVQNPPYTSYYAFGGKMVGMRRANQADPNTNGQYRIVSDHLGSSTLIVNAAATPQVVSRQYHKPYGEVAWSGGGQAMTSLTTIGYTGQRLDTDSGLMFYNARMYDPVLSHFVSADVIVSDPEVPQSLHRYSYVQDNPLRYTDPTGNCKYDGSDVGNLDCSLDDFDKMTAKERIAWVTAFAKNFGYGNAFNSILGVLDYFAGSEFMGIKPGKNWTSLADAGVLLAIQEGQYLFQSCDDRSRAFRGTEEQKRLLQTASEDWAAFFHMYKLNGGNWDNSNHGLLSFYGRAEQSGFNFGARLADDRRGRPTGVEGAIINGFIGAANVTRKAQRDGNFLGGLADPRNRDLTRVLAIGLETTVFRNYYGIPSPRFNPYGPYR